MSATTVSPGISPAAAVAHALALLDARPALAERQAQELLKVLPDDARGVFILGAARRRLGDAAGARAVLEPLAQAQPDSAYAQQELGLALAALGETAAAIAALRRAATLNAEMPQLWLQLSDQLSMAGDLDGAALAYAEHVRASVKDPQHLAAIDALREGRLRDAEQVLRRHLQVCPDDVAALRMLAETAARLGHLDDAEELLAGCLARAPGFVGARHNYALVLYQKNKAAEAIAELERLLADAPTEPKYLSLLAACLSYAGAFERAAEILAGLLTRHPRQPKLWLNYGQTLRVTGRVDEAIKAFRNAIALNPALGEPYWSLADLKTAQLGAADVAAMRALLATPAPAGEQRVFLHYALGKALEDAGDWQESFTHYAQGAALRRQAHPYDAAENSAWVAMSQRLFSREFFASRLAADGPESARSQPVPIFIVGLPRSGSTLIEQILASHSMVEATMELPDIIHICSRLGRAGRKSEGPAYPDVIAGLGAAECAALGAEYLARSSVQRRLGRACFIDKMPSNFFHVGLIRLILPQARIIDVRRHPMASCFAMFKQHFFRGQDFSYDLAEVGQYYRAYAELMAHFDTALPGWVHRVIYEDMIEDSEATIRRLLAFCGLPFEPGCAQFWQGGRAISTHSSEQVRRPIYRDGLEHWRHYAPWLGPLQAALGPVLATWRDTPAAAP